MHLDLIIVNALKNYNYGLWRKTYATHSKCVVRKELWVRVPPDRLSACGVTGSLARIRVWWSKDREGSIPSLPTIPLWWNADTLDSKPGAEIRVPVRVWVAGLFEFKTNTCYIFTELWCNR